MATLQTHDPIAKRVLHKLVKPPSPSSSTEGFFQESPKVLNQFHDDIALQRALGLLLPANVLTSIAPELSTFGDTVLSRPILDLVADAEKNPPYLKTWDSWGRRRDELITSEGWRGLSAMGIREGMVSAGYENAYAEHSRTVHFGKYLIWAGSAAWTTCPNLMTDGVAALLRQHLLNTELGEEERAAFRSAYERTTSRDPVVAWTTGQWMTERQGGSDVSQTETLAKCDPQGAHGVGTDGVPLGPWSINGFKWFSSATDCDMMVFLARTPKGISTFFAPMRRKLPQQNDMGQDSVLNGVQIQRLKNKLGTRALPTAELVLKDVRAYLVGEEGRGTKEIATVLNVARIHNAATAIGLWGRGLSIVRAFARVRKVGLKPLTDKSAYVRTLARLHADYKGNVLLTLFVASLLGVTEQPVAAAYDGRVGAEVHASRAIPDPKNAEHILRLLTPVLKGLTAKAAIAGLAECMECMGGVGYLENEDMQYNIARLFRDANVCSIWEGTTDMMAHDVLRVVYGKTSGEVWSAMDKWVRSIGNVHGAVLEEAKEVIGWWDSWKELLRRDRGEVEMRSREIMERLGDVVMAVLMIMDASRDDDLVALETVRSWVEQRRGNGATTSRWQEVVSRDMRIVFGGDTAGPRARI